VRWLGAASLLLAALSLAWFVRGLAAPVFHYGMGDSLLPDGSYRVERGALDTLRPGELVLLERDDPEALLAHGALLLSLRGVDDPQTLLAVQRRIRHDQETFAVFPVVVVALEEQRLSEGPDGLLVDGEPSEALPPHTWPTQPPLPTLLDAAIPERHVAVWDRLPYPDDPSLHLRVVPRHQIMGRLSQRSEDDDAFALVSWPPQPEDTP